MQRCLLQAHARAVKAAFFWESWEMRSSMLMVTCSAMVALIHGASAQAQTAERGAM
jgi:hypothetical protein